MMTTVHAHNAAQPLVDTAEKKLSRGRTAAVNFAPASTGEGLATAKEPSDGEETCEPVAGLSAAPIIGRTAAVNFVPASTGEASATIRILPELEGLFEGISVHGPVPIGSVADIVICTVKTTSIEEINSILAEEANSGRYTNVLGVSTIPLVSSDIIRDPRASIVDLNMTRVVGGDLVKIISWFDNEWGYSNQMIRTARQMMNVD
jgi:glyceraldehyde 3-phosphate dehydrogenase